MLIAIEDIDKAISLIRSSNDKTEAAQKLIANFDVDEEQAKAILDITLSRLTKLDKDDLLNELKSKKDIVAKNDSLINDAEFRSNYLIDEIIKMRDKYGDARRTKLENIEEPKTKEEKEVAFVPPEKCVVIMSDGGSLKRIPAAAFRTQRRGGKGVKTQDDIPSVTIRTNTVDSLMIFSNKGRMYRLIVNNIPEGTNSSRGTPVRALIEMEKDEDVQTIYSIYRDTDAKFVFLVTKKGVVKKVKLEELLETKRAKGLNIINYKDGDSLSVATLIKEEQVLLITKKGQTIRFETKDITPTGRTAMGVKGINIAEDDEVVAVLPIRNTTDDVAVFTNRGYGKRVKLADITAQNRGGKGVIIYKSSEENGEVTAAQLVNEEDTVLLVGNRKSICINVNEIPVLARTAIGVILLKDNEISSVSKV